jgi:hypothetical protein
MNANRESVTGDPKWKYNKRKSNCATFTAESLRVAGGSPASVKIRPFERESWLKKLGHRIFKEKWSHGRADQTQTAEPAK